MHQDIKNPQIEIVKLRQKLHTTQNERDKYMRLYLDIKDFYRKPTPEMSEAVSIMNTQEDRIDKMGAEISNLKSHIEHLETLLTYFITVDKSEYTPAETV